ncbi:MAG: flippase-like domain-containing protein [Bacteroidales bacterium]|nr:flippase-like domain-containing protein [Bacteroidales bacterium]MCM1148283.1 flippase-like domain-containing protein [Bacteroidales bacterium]MCM1206487.1 flippase-like domain-containing protein [Bacillota bacterium]MCM1510373.1 flippase-like domain-containing protein [Clostridium sp.]
MSQKVKYIFLTIGITAIIVMFLTFDISLDELCRDMKRTGFRMVAILGLWGGLYAMNTLAWRIIIRGSGDCPVSFLHLMRLTITGFALNYSTPVGLLGGEPYKVLAMTPHIGGQRATSSVVLFSMMHVFSHFWFWITSIFLYIIISPEIFLSPASYIVILPMTLFCLTGIYFFMKGYRNGMVIKLVSIIGRIPFCGKWAQSFYTAHSDELQKIDRQIAELHGQNKRSFYLSFVLEYAGRVLQSIEIFLILTVFGREAGMLTFVHSFLILSFTSLFANLLFVFPLQLGGREGGFVMSTAQMGMTTEVGIFISIVCRVRELFWAAIGMLFILKEHSRRQTGHE